jgi:TolB-like protein/DNA-binding winged helix-turn-helix (wHTH) protein
LVVAVPSSDFKFGEFELDCARFELRRDGRVLKLERIPLELLTLLAEKDGHVVTRQEIVERLWGKDVFVDTEHGINTAIRKIRAALREDAEKPRFVHTVLGKGYRLAVAPKNSNATLFPEGVATPVVPGVVHADAVPAKNVPEGHWDRRLVTTTIIAVFLLAGVLLEFNADGLRDRLFSKSQTGSIHSIAVLPLANLSGDPAQEYFADGMTDEIITALAKNHSLRVISRTSAMRYKNSSRPLPDIARELGVDGILEGSISRSANHVHTTVQLIYAPSDTHVWAESYDRDVSGAFSLPSELSQTIAREIKLATSPTPPQRYINPEAHDAFLRGRYYWYIDTGDYRQSKEYFEKAIQLQPDYAAAWAFLSASYGASAVGGGSPPQETFAAAWKDARKALKLDDSLPDAHNNLAAIYLFNSWDWHRAEVESLRALELDPNLSEGHHIYAYDLLAMNRDDESIQQEKQADEIDPFARPWALGLAYIHLHQYQAAVTELGARMQSQTKDSGFQFLLAEALHFNGMPKESNQHLEQMFLAAGDEQSAEAVRHAFEQGADRAVNEWLLSHDFERARKTYVSPMDLAFDYARLERKEETLHNLDAAVRERAHG